MLAIRIWLSFSAGLGFFEIDDAPDPYGNVAGVGPETFNF
jgi:hypothetical protein